MVTLTEEEAALAERLLSRLVDVRAGRDPASFDLFELAGGIEDARRERRHFFPDDLFADPAWDIILSLYCAEGRGERISITGLAHTIELAHTTAVRWIGWLTEAGLVQRERDVNDRRRHFLKLTDKTRHRLTQWLTRVAALMAPAPESKLDAR